MKLQPGALLAAAAITASLLTTPASTQDPAEHLTVFRKLAVGGTFPSLEVFGPDGKAVIYTPTPGQPTLIAFLRPDQESSRALLSFLRDLALERNRPASHLTAIGLAGRRGPSWRELGKGLPRELALFTDAGRVSRTLGLIVLPSVAVLDSKGRMARAYVLYDPEAGAQMRADLAALAEGRDPASADPAERAARRFRHLGRSAIALQAEGKLDEALAMRLERLSLGLESAQAEFEVGQTYFLLRQYPQAAEHLEASLAAGATLPARILLGRTKARLGRLEEARTDLMALLDQATDPAVVHRELAEIFRKLGDTHRALVHLKAAIEARRGATQEDSHGQD